MTRNLLIFAAAFLVGAVAALAARTAMHHPYAPPPAPAPAKSEPPVMAAPPAKAAAVNTVCAICGMAVKPELGTITYQGKEVGFGCAMCPPKFRAEPDRYGPAALQNQVVE